MNGTWIGICFLGIAALLMGAAVLVIIGKINHRRLLDREIEDRLRRL